MNIQSKKKDYGRVTKLMMNMIDKRISFTHEIITNEAFNQDKYYLPIEELKRKYYGYYENKVFRINKDFMKVIIDDNVEGKIKQISSKNKHPLKKMSFLRIFNNPNKR